ncbi:hypothetical protein VPH234P9_0037 [Vibrio phage 234P9]
MIGTYYSRDGKQSTKHKPLQLNSNFYRAIPEAEAVCSGKATNVSFERKSALIVPHSDNYRILISEF